MFNVNPGVGFPFGRLGSYILIYKCAGGQLVSEQVTHWVALVD